MPPASYRFRNADTGRELGAGISLAGSSRERRAGLLQRDELAAGSGLWINPCEAIHTWGMRFPIDVVFLDSRHRVLKLREALPARRICFCLRATSVLELPAGTVDRSATRPGHVLAVQAAENFSRPPALPMVENHP